MQHSKMNTTHNETTYAMIRTYVKSLDRSDVCFYVSTTLMLFISSWVYDAVQAIALLVRYISPFHDVRAFYEHLSALERLVREIAATLPAAAATAMRDQIDALRTTASSCAHPHPHGRRLRTGYAVTRWWLFAFFTFVNVAHRDVVPRWSIWMQLLMLVEFSWVAVKATYIFPADIEIFRSLRRELA